MTGTSNTSEVIYDGPWHYTGYHGCKSVCYLRLYQPTGHSDQAMVAVFTELAGNSGTSITNRIEVLATMAWEFLQRPEVAPTVVEHYPARGHYNPHTEKWQFPEQFDLLEFSRKPDGCFEKPRWRRVSRESIEALIGQTLRDLSCQQEPS